MSGIRPPDVRELLPGLCLLETEVDDFDVRSAVLAGEHGAVAWDTLAHPSQMGPVSALAGDRALRVVYSHADWDHCWGTCALEGVREVVAQETAAVRFVSDLPAELAARCRENSRLWGDLRLVAPTRVFSRDTTLDLGGLTLRLEALPGHTADSIVGLVPEWGVLLAGDAVETPLPVVNDGSAVPAWADALEDRLASGGFQLVVPSHGPVGGPEILERNLAYLRRLLAGRGGSANASLPSFYLRTHEQNVRLVKAALG
jgi:glyoxylase-like metal-dependent hydrolase (beta-lactamase superfamily II)